MKADSIFLFRQVRQEALNVIELCLNLAESRELNFELPADVANLLFNSCEDDGSARRRSCGPAFAALSSLTAQTALAAIPTLAVCALRAPRAGRLQTHQVNSIRCPGKSTLYTGSAMVEDDLIDEALQQFAKAKDEFCQAANRNQKGRATAA